MVCEVFFFFFFLHRPFAQSRATGRANVFLGASNRKARLIVVHIPQLVDQVRHSLLVYPL